MSGPFRTRVARTPEEVEGLRPAWEGFSGDVVNTDIDYHLMLLERSAEALRPHVVVVERDDGPSRVVVGRIEEVRLPARVGYATVHRPRVRSLTVSYKGVLGEDGDESAAVVADELVRALRDREADVVRLRNVEVGTPLHRAIGSRSGALTRTRLTLPSTHWRASLEGSYDDWLGRRSSKTRANIRRYGRKLEEAFAGRLDFHVFSDPAEVERLVEDTSEVYARTYQHGLGVGFSESGVEREVTAWTLGRGWFRGFILYVDGRPCAFWHGLRYGGVFTTGPTGYDPDFTQHRVGTYVLARMVEELCREDGLEWIDFGFGDAEYKRHFGDVSWLEDDVLLWARRPRPLALSAARTSVVAADRAARWALRSDLVGRARRLLRRRAREGRE